MAEMLRVSKEPVEDAVKETERDEYPDPSFKRKRPEDQDDSLSNSRSKRIRGRGGAHKDRGNGRNGKRRKDGGRREMGRSEWSEQKGDRRADNGETRSRREQTGLPIYATEFSKEEIEAEERKPKRKVAVMIGYSGTGYKGLQLNDKEKTIEGELFAAFVAAGAVSKANATDPKKVSLVRCARTDRGVHAAGNVISLKLIIEDVDIVQKINSNLSPQIRVYGLVRTNSSFSAYNLCDSRIYEYLIPTHCFIPPHPDSFLGTKLEELAKEANDLEAYRARQSEIQFFWNHTEEQYIRPILDELSAEDQTRVRDALQGRSSEESSVRENPTDAIIQENAACMSVTPLPVSGRVAEELIEAEIPEIDEAVKVTEIAPDQNTAEDASSCVSVIDKAVRDIKAAYLKAKKAYRIHPQRLAQVRSTASRYLGTQNYHNYTVDKRHNDPSAKRLIKSIVIEDPMTIGNTEWLSIKIHGQSFMMHQIRKMISMTALVVRCGCHEGRIQDTYQDDRISIPKAPGLGLLLERPVFDSYNEKMKSDADRDDVSFVKYQKEMDDFRENEIYQRIFREEERDNQFHALFTTVDNFRTRQMLYLSSMGIKATQGATDGSAKDANVQPQKGPSNRNSSAEIES